MTHKKKWREMASCAGLDTEMFFEQGTIPNTVAELCYDCSVKWECRLAGYAEEYGVWGNTSMEDRKRSRRSLLGRLYGGLLTSDEGLPSLRGPLDALADKPGDVLENMADAGFTETEIRIFTINTEADARGARRVQRDELVTTGRQ